MKYLRLILLLLFLNGLHAQDTFPPMNVELLINNSMNLTVKQGFPLVFDITISNESARDLKIARTIFEDEINDAPDSVQFKIDSLLAEATFRDENHSWDELILFTVKTPNNEVIDLRSKLHYLSQENNKAILQNGSDIVRISYGLDPEDSVIFKQSKYIIKVGLRKYHSNEHLASLWSNQVKLKVKLTGIKSTSQLADEKKYFIFSYFLARKRCSDAREIANSFGSTIFTPSELLILQADLYECEGDIIKALDYLNKALDIIIEENKYDPPDLLWDRIEYLQKLIYKGGS